MLSCFSSSPQEELGISSTLSFMSLSLNFMSGIPPIALGSRLHVSYFTGKVAEEKSSILVKVTQEDQEIQTLPLFNSPLFLLPFEESLCICGHACAHHARPCVESFLKCDTTWCGNLLHLHSKITNSKKSIWPWCWLVFHCK